jgi:hypothetical protein
VPNFVFLTILGRMPINLGSAGPGFQPPTTMPVVQLRFLFVCVLKLEIHPECFHDCNT